MNKKIVYLTFIFLIFGICINNVKALNYENYFGIEMTNTQYNNLINLGFNEEEIYYMDETTFNDNKDLNAELVAVNSKYYKSIYTDLNGITQTVELSKEEYENEANHHVRGYVQTEYKRMDTYISKKDSTSYRYKVTVGWLRLPSTRSYDIIGLAFEGNQVAISGFINFQYSYCTESADCYNDGSYYYQTESSYAGSKVYKFPTSARSMTAKLYFDVEKNTTETITTQKIYGDYAHATSNVNYSHYSEHVMSRGGLSLSANAAAKYDSIPCAETSWAGTW